MEHTPKVTGTPEHTPGESIGSISYLTSLSDRQKDQVKTAGSKYHRDISYVADGRVDVYSVLEAFEVKCPARQHAIKKLLCSGIRGKGDTLQDLREAAEAVDRAVQLELFRQQK